MLPLIEIDGTQVPTYLLVGALGWMTAAALGLWQCHRLDVSAGRFLVALVAASAGALLGSKLWFEVLEQGHPSRLGDLAHAAVWLSGHSALGGITGAAILLAMAGLFTRTPIPIVLDSMTAPAAAGLAIGRLGCLASGCCWGRPTLFPIAIVYHDFAAPVRPIGVPLQPAPLYLAIAHLVLLAAVLWRTPRRAFPGELTLLYIAGYAALRLAVEALRADPRGRLFGAPLSIPTLAVVGLAAAVVLAALHARRRPVSRGESRPSNAC